MNGGDPGSLFCGKSDPSGCKKVISYFVNALHAQEQILSLDPERALSVTVKNCRGEVTETMEWNGERALWRPCPRAVRVSCAGDERGGVLVLRCVMRYWYCTARSTSAARRI